MAKGTSFDQIRKEIAEKVVEVQTAYNKAVEEENKIRAAYAAAQQEMTAALESGSMEQYKAAGLKAEEKRLELEFFEKSKKKGPKPTASEEDNSRILIELKAESRRICTEALPRLKEKITGIANDCDETLKQLQTLEDIARTWGTVVMRESNPEHVVRDEYRLFFTQVKNAQNAEISRFDYMDQIG